MQQAVGGLQLQQPLGACSSRAAPLPAAWGLLAPQRQRSVLVCRARKPRTELAAPEVSSPSHDPPPPRPSPPHQQQHAQLPRLREQQQEQPEGQEGALLNKLRKPQKQQQPPQRQPPPQQQPRAAPRRAAPAPAPGGANGAGGSAASAAAAPPGSSDEQAAGAGAAAAAAGAAAAAAAAGPDTQLIFRLERRGDGWAEEILPHLVVEQRPLATKKKRAYSRPDPWKEGSLECFLVELGLPPDDVDRVVTQAVAWRVTPGGRTLIDRRRRSRVERNVRLVVEHLELECGVPFGPRGIAAILARCPEVMLCKPTTNDRWDRRAVELSAFLLRQGHCNVPEDWEENPELGLWVKRQRIARAAGQLSEERLSILQSMGFAFGEVAQLTEEWEHRFDQLVDWMLWHNENHQRFSWLGVDWGARGGITARELALWSTLQREYRARGLLPGEALSRFEAIGMQWDTPDGTPAECEWMAWFGRLLYVIERHNTLQQPARHQSGLGRPKMGRPRGSRAAAEGGVLGGGGGGGELAGGEGEEAGDSSDEEEEAEAPSGGARRGSAAVAAARQRLQAEMAARRAALAAADLHAEPGLRFWLARQRRRWRVQELLAELALMLQLAGVQLDPYSPVEWQAAAHAAAAALQGSRISLDPRTRQQLRSQQAAAAAAAAAVAVPPQPQPAALAGRGEQAAAGAGAAAAAWAAERQLAAAAAAAAPAPAPAAGSPRLRAARWVQTQQALFAEGKLSPAQLRYMAFLGITWLLSEEVTHMREAVWREWCARLAAAPRPAEPRGELREWLQHQRGLHALGWLPPRRRAALAALQVRLDVFDRCPADEEWDARLSELLAHKAEHGDCRLLLPPGEAVAAAAVAAPPGQPAAVAAAAPRQRWAPLAAWLAEQHRLLAAGRLPAQRATQLAAIGAAPPPPRGPPPRPPQQPAGAA